MRTEHNSELRSSLSDKVITRIEQLMPVVERLSDLKMFAYDTEFVRETTFHPQLEIIQLADATDSWIVDVQAFRKTPEGNQELDPLRTLFLNPKIIKIVHAAVGDQEAIYSNLGVLPTPVFDTAIGASLCGLGESIGLSNLLKAMLDVRLKKGHARTHWGIRPLPDQLIEYALADVDHLVPLTEKLFAKLDRLGRKEWAFAECEKFSVAKFIDPGAVEIATKLARTGRVDAKGFPVLIELLKWRERRVRDLNRPRKWVAEDSILVDLAHVRPRDLEHLSTFRGINKTELKTSAQEILNAIKKGLAAKPDEYPLPPRSETPGGEEQRILELLKCYLGIRADELELSPNLLVHSQQLIKLIRVEPCTAEAWVEAGVMSRPVAELVGKDLERFLHGQVVLSVVKGKVHAAAH